MAVTESWVLDGIELTSGNFGMLELNADPPKARPDWVTSADSEHAALVRDPLHENRVITMKLRVMPQASMDAALDQVGAIRDKLRRASNTTSGIGLVWTPANSTRSRTFDVLTGEITELPIALSDQGVSWLKYQRPIFTLEMTCKPYWRGTEVLTGTTTASTPVITHEVASVPGDIPALGRLIVTDAATQARRFVEWGLENQFYTTPGTSQPLTLDSDSLVISGFVGTQTTATGAYDPNASGNSAITAALYRSNPTAVCGTGAQSHVGTFRVKLRASSNSTDARLRLSWQEGDGPWQDNPWASAPISSGFAEWDLGTITIPTAVSGSQRWIGRIEGMVATGITDTVYIDYLTFIPAAEGYGRSRAAYQYVSGARIARDEFTGTTAPNPLNTRVAPTGGTWATSGATGDFLFTDGPGSEEAVQRSTASDTGVGRVAVLGSATTNIEVGVRVYNASGSTDPNQVNAVVARFVDASNFLRAELGPRTFTLYKRIAGTDTRLAQAAYGRQGTTPYYLRLVVYTTGFAAAMLLDAYSNILVMLQGRDSVLATGGTLASGNHGFSDQNATANTFARYYNFFYAATPEPEPLAINSGQSLEVRHNDTIREDSTGVYYGRTPSYWGSRFLVPPGTSRVAVKARRDDVITSAEANVTDSTSVQVAYQPRGLVVPR